MLFDQMEYELDAQRAHHRRADAGEEFIPADDVILAIGQENAFPWIERDIGIEFDKWDVPMVDKVTFQSMRAGVFFGGDAAFGPRTSSGRWSTATRRPSPCTVTARARRWVSVCRAGMNLASRKMGMHEWSYANDYTRWSGG